MNRRPERLGDLLPGVLAQLAATHTATNGEPPMASDADKVRKDLIKRGYRVEKPVGRGKTSYVVIDPATEKVIARFPRSPSAGSWQRNLDAAIRRYERTGVPARSDKVPGKATA